MMGGLVAASIGSIHGAYDLFAKPLTPSGQARGHALADHALEPGAYQHQVSRARRQQCDGERDMDALAGGLEDRSHDGENIGRFYQKSLGQCFFQDSGLVYDSGTQPEWLPFLPDSRRYGPAGAPETETRPAPLRWFTGAIPMPYALFSNDAKLSKAYPTEADVWKHARQSGLVVDVMSPRPVLDNDYEIRPCRPDPQED